MPARSKKVPAYRPVIPPPPGRHFVSPGLMERNGPIKVVLVGAGGNGSRMLTGLAQLHTALVALGGYGLSVTTFDPDRVSEANIGRQLFYPADVGQNKAVLLTTRVNLCYGLDWQAMPQRYPGGHSEGERPEVLITCVDTAKARREIHRDLLHWQRSYYSPYYWLDLANEARFGQVILGQPKCSDEQRYLIARKVGAEVERRRLPMVTELHPALLHEGYIEIDTPSCSVAEALQKQDLFINPVMSVFALDLLWRLLRTGGLDYHGCYVNLETYSVNPIPVDGGGK